MQTKILILIFCAGSFLQTMATPSLAPEEAQHYQDLAKDMLVNYYSGLNALVGIKMSFEDKQQITDNLIANNFRSPNAIVFNDYQRQANIKELPIREYLDQLNTLYNDEKLGITFTDPVVNVTGIYVSGDSFIVKAVVQWSLVSTSKPDMDTKADVDYYFSFYPGKGDIKVYFMNNHTENASSFVPASIQNKTYLTNNTSDVPNNQTQELSQTFLTFQVKPNNATIKVNGQPIYSINGMKILSDPGNKKIEVSAPGYQSYVIQSFNAKSGNNTISAELIQNLGTLTIEANKKSKDAQVLIDGKPIGYAPLSRIPLTEGFHSVQVLKAGFFPKRKNVKIKVAKDENWTVDMVNIEHLKTAGKVIGGVANYFLKGGH